MKKILVVEDDAAIRGGLAEALEREHYQVETAADGEEGLKKGREKECRPGYPGPDASSDEW